VQIERLFEGYALPRVVTAAEHLRRRASVGAAREALLHPRLEAPAYARSLHAAVAVDPPAERDALLAGARVPARGGRVAVEILRLAVAVARLDPHDHTVLGVGPEQAVVRVVGSTEEVEVTVRRVEVSVLLLPAAVRIRGQRIAHRQRRHEVVRGEEIAGHRHRAETDGARQAQEAATRDAPIRAHSFLRDICSRRREALQIGQGVKMTGVIRCRACDAWRTYPTGQYEMSPCFVSLSWIS
jgi:hypothetical protein